MSRTSRLRCLAAVLVLALAAAACGGGRSDGGAGGDGSSDTSATDQPTAETFGDLASPCGPADGESNSATEQGVTADSVSIGYGDDAGYQGSPGLNHQISDAMKA